MPTKMQLYRVVNRELVYVRPITVPDGIRDFDAWLSANHFDRTYTLRRGIVTEPSPAERASLTRAHDALKQSGKLPSAADRIIGKLTKR